MESNDYLEVETPMMQPMAGGAAALLGILGGGGFLALHTISRMPAAAAALGWVGMAGLWMRGRVQLT